MSFGGEPEEMQAMEQQHSAGSEVSGEEGTTNIEETSPALAIPHVPKTTVVSAPTASETEAANILTTIKSGEILSLHNAELLAGGSSGVGNENIM